MFKWVRGLLTQSTPPANEIKDLSTAQPATTQPNSLTAEEIVSLTAEEAPSLEHF